MINSELLLSAVAFIVGFSLSFLVNRNIQTAFFTGLIAVPACFAGLIAVNVQRRMHQKRILTGLQMQIRQMEKWKNQLTQYLWAIAEQYDRIEEAVTSRQNQLNQLHILASEKQKYKQKLTLEVIGIGEDKRKREEEIYHLDQKKEELDLSVRSLKAEHHKAETYLNELQAKFKQIQEEIILKQMQKDHLEETLDFLRSQLHQWETEDIEIQEINHPIRELTPFYPPNLLNAATDEQPSDNLDEEWAAFVAQLTYPELEVLKAIVQQDNPNPTIKTIAESNITMPELLIDGINERAIATIGDIIIEPGTDSPVIADSEYLEQVKKLLEVKAIK
jgi:TerB-C domain